MHTRPLGTTDLTPSVLAFGTAPLGELFGPVEEKDARRLVDLAIDLGINFFDTSPYYGSAERRLGAALSGKRDSVIVGTKAGQLGDGSFDFTARGIRRSVQNSLRLLGTDHVDILQLHDIEHGDIDLILDEGYAELVRLREEGLCRFIGMTGYPLALMSRVLRETKLDVLLSYAHGTLLDDSIREVLTPIATERGTGLINAAAVALGLLTPGGSTIEKAHPAPEVVRQAAARMVASASERGADIAFVANQYSIQRSGCATTLIGTGKARNLESAARAATTPLDEELLAELLALRPAPARQQWDAAAVPVA